MVWEREYERVRERQREIERETERERVLLVTYRYQIMVPLWSQYLEVILCFVWLRADRRWLPWWWTVSLEGLGFEGKVAGLSKDIS